MGESKHKASDEKLLLEARIDAQDMLLGICLGLLARDESVGRKVLVNAINASASNAASQGKRGAAILLKGVARTVELG